MVPKMSDKPFWESVWSYLDPWDSVRLLTASTHWSVPKKYGPQKKEPLVLSGSVEFGPSIPAETVKACALIGLHMMAEENALRSDKDSSRDLGEMWKYGCPKKSGFEWRRLWRRKK